LSFFIELLRSFFQNFEDIGDFALEVLPFIIGFGSLFDLFKYLEDLSVLGSDYGVVLISQL